MLRFQHRGELREEIQFKLPGYRHVQAVKRPRLYGPGELAVLFGVSRQRVLQITRRPGFPEPVARLIGMTVWDADEVDEWARHNRPPRPTDDEER